tara:strand:+ start:161 stop:1132 length:972 start_codon:yes stop_codon:yes gene_type:complete
MVTMNDPYAVAVIPTKLCSGELLSRTKRWLSRGKITSLPRSKGMLDHVLAYLRIESPGSGYAALRYRGQGGQETGWIAAADPLYLRPRMRDVVAHSFIAGQLDSHDFEALFESLQTTLGDNSQMQFESNGVHGYLKCKQPIATAGVSTDVIDGQVPTKYEPRGISAGSYQTLQTEVQMLLHQNSINHRIEKGGGLPVNALWFWGGGFYPHIKECDLPLLFSEDPLFNGYWVSCGAQTRLWLGDFGSCIDKTSGSFVSVLPNLNDDSAQRQIEILLRHVKKGDLKSAFLLFSDYFSIEVKRHDFFRVWSGISPLFDNRVNDERE